MKIEINIDAHDLDGTIVGVFNSLTEEEKKDMAKEAMKKWLDEPHRIEEQAKYNLLLPEFKERYKNSGETIYVNGWRKVHECTDDQIIKTSEFQKLVANFKSSKDEMIAAITKETIDHYRFMATEMVKTDPQLQKIMQQTLEGIKQDFPKFIHDAMLYWFTQNMQAMMNASASALAQSSQSMEISNKLFNEITGRTGNNLVYGR